MQAPKQQPGSAQQYVISINEVTPPNTFAVDTQLIKVCCPNCRFGFSTVLQAQKKCEEQLRSSPNAKYSKKDSPNKRKVLAKNEHLVHEVLRDNSAKREPPFELASSNFLKESARLSLAPVQEASQQTFELKRSLYEQLGISDILEKKSNNISLPEQSVVNLMAPSSISDECLDPLHQLNEEQHFAEEEWVFQLIGLARELCNHRVLRCCLERELQALAFENVLKTSRASFGISFLFSPNMELSSIAKAIGLSELRKMDSGSLGQDIWMPGASE